MAADAVATTEIRGAPAGLRRATGLPVAFGGAVGPGAAQIRIGELSGTATGALRSLVVTSGTGLGGRAVALGRACAVPDYAASRRISREYDVPVAAEGLRAVPAVPLVVRHRVRGVPYGALRTARPPGGAVAAAREVERALVVRDGARGLPAALRPAEAGPPEREAGREHVREAHAALRAPAPRIAGPGLRAELPAACDLLAASPTTGRPGPAPRELDVLTWVATGATNAAVADRPGLRPATAKGYPRAAMRKLGAHTRGEAVTAARRAGVLP
ncbi:LuxR C-terminal-related transcriptional regulator [Streptomyces sp. NPDC058459]|uniref:helix-turn-helix transcriptional regulator n=1 Tax=Streptomyces sp. NPDC058459 TaxID=3346508 RepID=UPI003667045F